MIKIAQAPRTTAIKGSKEETDLHGFVLPFASVNMLSRLEMG